MITELDETNFESYLDSATNPVVVDFWASWCKPCAMMNPILEELSTELTGKVLFAKVDVDANPAISAGVTSIPTLKVFVRGVCVKEITGAKPKPALLKILEETL